MGAIRGRGVKLFISAGEASGDVHGASVAQAVFERWPKTTIACMGGKRLQEAGAELLVDNRDVAVVGLVEVLHHARSLYAAWRKIRSFLLHEKPDLVILIDFPDFNFLIGRMAHRCGIKVLYYISPQVWAWRSGRARSLKAFTDAMAVILPFERDFYLQRGMQVHYVGHPLLDLMKAAPSREAARLKLCSHGNGGPVIGLLAGSRRSEIASLLHIMLGAARRIQAACPEATFLLPVAPSIDPDQVRALVEHHQAPVRVVEDDTYGAMRACDLLLAASGTVTLEAAILNVPMIIVYKMSPVTWHVGRRLVRVSHVGLPNVIAGRRIVPELLQDQVREEVLAAEAMALLKNPERLERQRLELSKIKGLLGEPGVPQRVAQLAMDTIRGQHP